MNNKGFTLIELIFVIVILLIIAAPIFYVSAGYFNVRVVTDKVLKTERVVDSDGKGSRYLVYGAKETYEDSDSLVFFKFNSSDVYGQIEQGHTYQFKVYGWRIPFLSSYRNIISDKEIK